ncbi:39S ribosomal protein L46, mitochondrial-like [Dendronephthya gigantea]|uniref:39S ribosomal protein L46, mitochondrial-like n=1 Tax=Dendronephthya gigantea TaxID=151771 RepID=UPI001069CAA6|nr:39S ribosomal protein L46, mitochondrial-like [Dendronephthya gigantea]
MHCKLRCLNLLELRCLNLAKRRCDRSVGGLILHKNGLCKRSYSSTAIVVDTQSGLDYEIPQITVAVCLLRLPVISRKKTDLEKLYEDLQEQLEFEHSSLSDYEVNINNMENLRERLKNDEDNESLKKEVATLDAEYQELQEIEQKHIKDAFLGSRRTDADKTDNNHSPNRQLEVPLFLLIKSKNDRFQLPQGTVKPGETLRQAAERIINNHIPSELNVQFMSNAPSGVYRRAERDGLPTNTPKVFFYQGNLQGTIHKYSDDDIWTNSIWTSKEELTKYLPKNYYQSVMKFLL